MSKKFKPLYKKSEFNEYFRKDSEDGSVIEFTYNDEYVPSTGGGILEASTDEEANALLTANNVGQIFKFTGESTDNYISGELYEICETEDAVDVEKHTVTITASLGTDIDAGSARIQIYDEKYSYLIGFASEDDGMGVYEYDENGNVGSSCNSGAIVANAIMVVASDAKFKLSTETEYHTETYTYWLNGDVELSVVLLTNAPV